MPEVVQKLAHRHYRLALLAAAGHTNVEIAAQIGMSDVRVGTLLKDTQIHGLVEQYRKQFFDRAALNLEQQIAGDGINTFTRLKELRDQKRDLKVALGASNTLFDRQAPKRTLHQEDRVIRFEFTQKERQAIDAVLDESTIIDVTPHADPTPTG